MTINVTTVCSTCGCPSPGHYSTCGSYCVGVTSEGAYIAGRKAEKEERENYYSFLQTLNLYCAECRKKMGTENWNLYLGHYRESRCRELMRHSDWPQNIRWVKYYDTDVQRHSRGLQILTKDNTITCDQDILRDAAKKIQRLRQKHLNQKVGKKYNSPLISRLEE